MVIEIANFRDSENGRFWWDSTHCEAFKLSNIELVCSLFSYSLLALILGATYEKDLRLYLRGKQHLDKVG